MKLQLVRRFVQACVLLLITAIPLLSLYAHYRAARSIDDAQLMQGLRGAVATRAIHPYVERVSDPQAFLDANKGTLWSMRVANVEWTDPLAALEMTAASKRIHWPLITSIAIPVLLTLILGKVFCSWICPAYVLFELTGKLRRLLRLAEIEPGEVRFSHRNKYVFLAVGTALAAIFSGPLFALVYPPAVVTRAIHAWVFGTTLAGMIALLGAIVAIELFVSPRWWCRTMCPGGALYGLIGWLRPVRIKLRTEACTGCKECIPVCEEGLNPITQSNSIECDNCGVCIRHCGDGALYYTIALPGLDRRPKHEAHVVLKAKEKQPDRRIAVSIVLSALLHSQPGRAEAHHILGLPHYSYKENYPQRPTLEYPATTGPYDVLLTSYPGIPVPGEPANLALYIRDREAQRAYGQSISLRVLRTSTFGDNELIMSPTTRFPVEHEYKVQVTFPTDGEYIVELSMSVEGRTEVIPFLMIAGEPSAAASIALAGSSGFVMLLVVIRAIQKKRRRRRAMNERGDLNRTRFAVASEGCNCGHDPSTSPLHLPNGKARRGADAMTQRIASKSNNRCRHETRLPNQGSQRP